MTTSTKSQSLRTTQQLTIVVATIRWNAARVGGRCADCHRLAPSDAMPRALVHLYAGQPPEQLVRLSQVAPDTHAESAQVDRWLTEIMRRQARPQRPQQRQLPVISRAICWECATRLLDGFLGNAGGTFSGALAAIVPDQWSALMMACDPGFGHELNRFAFNGHGRIPALPELLALAATPLHDKPEGTNRRSASRTTQRVTTWGHLEKPKG